MSHPDGASEIATTLETVHGSGDHRSAMAGLSSIQSGNVLNLGDLLRASVRSEVLARVPTWLQSDGHGGRYVHPAGRWASQAFAAARSTPYDSQAPGHLLHRTLAEWGEPTTAPGGLALHERMSRILGISPEQRIVEIDPDAVAEYPEPLRASSRVGRVEDHLDWLLPTGRPTVLVLDPYNYAGRRAREIALAAAADPAATAARLDSYLQPETVAEAILRLRACCDGVMLVFATTDRDAGEQPIRDLHTDLAGLLEGAAVATLVARPTARPGSGVARIFAVAVLGFGDGERHVRDVTRDVQTGGWIRAANGESPQIDALDGGHSCRV